MATVWRDGIARVPYSSLTDCDFDERFVRTQTPVVLTADGATARSGLQRWSAFEDWQSAEGVLRAFRAPPSPTTSSASPPAPSPPAPEVSVLVSADQQFDGQALGHQTVTVPFDELVQRAFGAVRHTETATAASLGPSNASAAAAASAAAVGNKRKLPSDSADVDAPTASTVAALTAAVTSLTAPSAVAGAADGAAAHYYLCQCPIFTALPLKQLPTRHNATGSAAAAASHALPAMDVAHSPLRALLPSVSPMLSVVPASRVASINAWLSAGRSSCTLHYDDNPNVLCVVVGTKVATLFPPSDTPYLYPQPITSDSANHSRLPLSVFKAHCHVTDRPTASAASASDVKLGTSQSTAKPMSVTTTAAAPAASSAALGPFGRFAEARGVQTTLRRGDALFIPSGWWHQIDSFGRGDEPSAPAPTAAHSPTLAVNIWWTGDFQLLTTPLPVATATAATSKPPAAEAKAPPLLSGDSNAFFLRTLAMQTANAFSDRALGLDQPHATPQPLPVTAAARTKWIDAFLLLTARARSATALDADSQALQQHMHSVQPASVVSLLAEAATRPGAGAAAALRSAIESLSDQHTALLTALFDRADEQLSLVASPPASDASGAATNASAEQKLGADFAALYSAWGSDPAAHHSVALSFIAKKQRWLAHCTRQVLSELGILPLTTPSDAL